MKTALGLLAVATILAAPSLSATQSRIQSVIPGIQESTGELTPAVERYVGRGDEFSSQLRYDAAVREYSRAADIARHEGHLASGTTWKLASAHFYNGNPLQASAVLDRLADDAALVGDLEVEALSIYYSAWLNGKAGRKAEAATRVARLEGLLQSKYMPVALRDRLSDWLKTSKEVAVH
jgi:hypothetical protein